MKLGKQKKNVDDNQVQVLLKECELCSIDANHLEDSIWAATGILITASVAGLGFFASSIPKNFYDFFVRIGITILSIIIIRVWHRIVKRWYSIQQVMYFRVEEIEKELHMRKNCYIAELDDHVQKNSLLSPSLIPFWHGISNLGYQGRTVRKSIDKIERILIFSWAIFGLMQVLIFLQLFGAVILKNVLSISR